MTLNLSDILPALGALATALGTIWLNNRKQSATAKTEAAAAGQTAAKSQYEIWQTEWARILKATEDRIQDLQESLDASNADLKSAREELRTVHIENGKMLAQLADCRRRMKKAGIPNGDDE